MAERFQLSYDERFFAYAQLIQRALPAPLLRPEGETIFVLISYLISLFPNRSTDNERNAAKSSAAKRTNGNGWNAVDAIPVVKSWSEHETR